MPHVTYFAASSLYGSALADGILPLRLFRLTDVQQDGLVLALRDERARG